MIISINAMYMSLPCRCPIAVLSHDYSPKSLVEGGRPKAAPLGTKRRALVFVGRLKAALYPERFLQLCFPAPLTLSFQGPLITSTRSTWLSDYYSSPSLQQNHRARTSWARLWRALISSIYIVYVIYDIGTEILIVHCFATKMLKSFCKSIIFRGLETCRQDIAFYSSKTRVKAVYKI